MAPAWVLRHHGRNTMNDPIQLLFLGPGEPDLSTSAYGPFVVHVFATEPRSFYQLERLWGDRPRVEWAVRERTGGSG